MNKIASLFKKFDEFLFRLIDLMKASPVYTQVHERVLSLSTQQQKILNRSLALAIIGTPLLILIFIFASNYSLRNQNESKRSIIEILEVLADQKGKAASFERSLSSPMAMNSIVDMEAQITELLNSRGIDTKKVKVNDFSKSESVSLNKVEADLHFSNFSLVELTKLLSGLHQNSRVKISELSINKDKESAALNGIAHILQFTNK